MNSSTVASLSDARKFAITVPTINEIVGMTVGKNQSNNSPACEA
jgi:hypothetical protein